MEERTISAGASCFLIKDESLKQGWRSTIYDWLKAEGFITWGRKGTYNTDWIYINIFSKVYAPGVPGVGVTKVVGDHAITFEEFKTIYNIYKKYEGFGTLKMNEQEQKAFEEYCAKCEANKPKWEAWEKEFGQPPGQMDLTEYKQKVRKCLIDMQNCTPERADELMASYEEEIKEALFDIKWPPNVIAGAMTSGLW